MAPPLFTTFERVKSSLGIGPYDGVDDDWLVLVVDATNQAVCEWRPDLHWRHCGSCQDGQYSPGQFSPADYGYAYVTSAGSGSGRIQHRGRGCCCFCHGAGGSGANQGGQFVGTDFVWGDYVTNGSGTGSGQGTAWYYLGDARVALGATMLASRWYKRRGSDEIAAFTEFGGPPPTVDKDVETLLQINRAFRPVVS